MKRTGATLLTFLFGHCLLRLFTIRFYRQSLTTRHTQQGRPDARHAPPSWNLHGRHRDAWVLKTRNRLMQEGVRSLGRSRVNARAVQRPGLPRRTRSPAQAVPARALPDPRQGPQAPPCFSPAPSPPSAAPTSFPSSAALPSVASPGLCLRSGLPSSRKLLVPHPLVLGPA